MLPAGKTIIIAGLDGDIYKKPFGEILFLIPYSIDCVKLNAKCLMCAKEGIDKDGIPKDKNAPFTKLILNNSNKLNNTIIHDYSNLICNNLSGYRETQSINKQNQTLVGGKETYMAVCDNHFNN
jgi:thymidine kinase